MSLNYINIPDKCPICNHKLTIQISDSGVETLWCKNPQCEGKLINRIDHFVSKKGLDIHGLSKATIEKLINWGWVNSISDMFNLSDRKEAWIAKQGFGEKSVNNILESIKTSSNTNLESIISAAGIPLIGRTVAREIVKIFPTYGDFRGAVDGDYDFSTISGFGYEMNKALKNYDYTELDCIINNYLTIETKEEVDYAQMVPGSSKFDGLTICITGKLNTYKNRDELKTFIINRGGKVTDSVSKNTSYLICNDLNSTSSKMKKAKELGIPILTEDQFNASVDF